MRNVLAIVVFGAIFASSGFAASQTESQTAAFCKSDAVMNDKETVFCKGFLEGLAEGRALRWIGGSAATGTFYGATDAGVVIGGSNRVTEFKSLENMGIAVYPDLKRAFEETLIKNGLKVQDYELRTQKILDTLPQ